MPVRDRGRVTEDDPKTVIGAAYRYANEQKPMTVIALVLIGLLAYLYFSTLSAVARDLRDHSKESGWYQREMCLSLAELAGSNPERCKVQE